MNDISTLSMFVGVCKILDCQSLSDKHKIMQYWKETLKDHKIPVSVHFFSKASKAI